MSNTLPIALSGLLEEISTIIFSLKFLYPNDDYAACWFPLITGRGGCKLGGGASAVLPLQKKGESGKSFSYAEGGAQQVLR